MTHLKVNAHKLQVKSAAASWALLYCEFNLTATIMFVVIVN